MFHRWAALVLVLALCAMSPKNAAGQGQVQQPRGHGAKGKLGISYPNPFNPDTYLPFTVGEEGCAVGSGQYRVTMKLVNVLGQVVAEPILYDQDQSSTTPAALRGKPIHDMVLPCGPFTGYWDGKVRGREAASGVYGQILFIDADPPLTRKIYYKK
jgi:hypothetical protein